MTSSYWHQRSQSLDENNTSNPPTYSTHTYSNTNSFSPNQLHQFSLSSINEGQLNNPMNPNHNSTPGDENSNQNEKMPWFVSADYEYIDYDDPINKNKKYHYQLNVIQRIFILLDDPNSCIWAKFFSAFMIVVILISCSSYVLSSDPGIKHQPDTCSDPVCDHNPELCPDSIICQPRPPIWFSLIEIICVSIFTIDYGLRVLLSPIIPSKILKIKVTTTQDNSMVPTPITSPEEIGEKPDIHFTPSQKIFYYTLQVMNIIDLVAIIPFYIKFVTASESSIAVVRVLRLARILRIFKTGKYNEGSIMLYRTLSRSMPVLTLLFFFLMIGIVLFAALIYFCESGKYMVTEDYPNGAYLRKNMLGTDFEPSPFKSISVSCYWVVVTATTVGFGDFYPTSPLGRLLACLLTFCGVLVLALPITVVGSNFTEVYKEFTSQEKKRKKEMLKAFLRKQNSLTPSVVQLDNLANLRPSPGSLLTSANAPPAMLQKQKTLILDRRKSVRNVNRYASMKRLNSNRSSMSNRSNGLGARGDSANSNALTTTTIPYGDDDVVKTHSYNRLPSNLSTNEFLESKEAPNKSSFVSDALTELTTMKALGAMNMLTDDDDDNASVATTVTDVSVLEHPYQQQQDSRFVLQQNALEMLNYDEDGMRMEGEDGVIPPRVTRVIHIIRLPKTRGFLKPRGKPLYIPPLTSNSLTIKKSASNTQNSSDDGQSVNVGKGEAMGVTSYIQAAALLEISSKLNAVLVSMQLPLPQAALQNGHVEQLSLSKGQGDVESKHEDTRHDHDTKNLQLISKLQSEIAALQDELNASTSQIERLQQSLIETQTEKDKYTKLYHDVQATNQQLLMENNNLKQSQQVSSVSPTVRRKMELQSNPSSRKLVMSSSPSPSSFDGLDGQQLKSTSPSQQQQQQNMSPTSPTNQRNVLTKQYSAVNKK